MTECCVATVPACFADGFADEFGDDRFQDTSVQGWVRQAFVAERAPQRVGVEHRIAAEKCRGARVVRNRQAARSVAQSAAQSAAVRSTYWWLLAVTLAVLVFA